MSIQEQIQIVEDNLKEYGQCNITIEEYNYLKDEIYSDGCLAGIELGRTDAERDFQNSDYWNDYLAKVIADAKADTIEECIDKLYEVTPQTIDQKLDMVFVNALKQLKERK